jgi:hypothetical protein
MMSTVGALPGGVVGWRHDPGGEGPTQMKNDPPSPAPPLSVGTLFSVGHSNHDLPSFLALLRRAGVTAVADVRSSPYSRRLPQFSRDALRDVLRREGIGYVYLGDVLGGRPPDRALYDAEGRVDYESVRRTAAFQEGLDRLLRGLETHAVAMLCAEDDPLDCHRGLMVTPAAREHGVAPLHLRKDGSVETTDDMERRLLKATGLADQWEGGLFAPLLTADDRRAVLAEAYRRMNRRKAFQLAESGMGDDLPAG